MEDPDNDAFHYIKAPPQPTYRVYFWQKDLWEGYQVPPYTHSSSWIAKGPRADIKCCSFRV